jgi:hypothetical protein
MNSRNAVFENIKSINFKTSYGYFSEMKTTRSKLREDLETSQNSE